MEENVFEFNPLAAEYIPRKRSFVEVDFDEESMVFQLNLED